MNFYWCFVKDYSKIARSLTELLKGSVDRKKQKSLQWGEVKVQVFKRLHTSFISAPMLIHFNPEFHLRIKTDALGYALAGILSQLVSEGTWHPVTFWSRKMIPAEQQYKTHDQELLAIVMAFKQWRHYLEGSTHSVEVLTDYNNLHRFMNVKSLNGRQARWAVKFAAYNFVILHCSEKSNPADASSRQPDYQEEEQVINHLLPSLQQKLAQAEELKAHEQPVIAQLGSLLCSLREKSNISQTRPENLGIQSSEMPDSCMCSCGAVVAWGQVSLPLPQLGVIEQAAQENFYNDLISRSMMSMIRALQACNEFCTWQKQRISPSGQRARKVQKTWHVNDNGLLQYSNALFVPDDIVTRAELLWHYHDDFMTGHFGVKKTHDLLERKFFWQSMWKNIQKYVGFCNICQRIKASHHCLYGSLASLPVPDGPW